MSRRIGRVALFDYDGTVRPGDSILPYLLTAIRRGYAPPAQLPRAAAAFLRQTRDGSYTSKAKAVTLSFIRGRSPGELEELGRAFLAAQAKRFYPEAVREMRALREAGFEVAAVSASPSVYMRLLPEVLPVDRVICTECVVRDGAYTGEIGPNCKGEEKARRVRAAFPPETEIGAAYGDSASDAPMLRLAERAVWINPRRHAAELVPGAERRRWGRGK